MVVPDSIYSKRFVSNNLTAQKYGELLDIAVRIRDHKNIISQYVCEHLFEYLDVSTFDFLKEMRAKHSELSSSFDKQCYEECKKDFGKRGYVYYVTEWCPGAGYEIVYSTKRLHENANFDKDTMRIITDTDHLLEVF